MESNAHAADAASTDPKLLSAVEREARLRELDAPVRRYARVLAGIGFGGGLRFNNPYRLATQFGTTGESLSATAPYVTLSAAATFGAPDGLQHGGFTSISFALTGVDQAVLTPGYMLLYRGPSRLLGYARVGPAFVLSPQTNVGGEIAVGSVFFLTGGLGVSLDLAGNIFYGASTWEKKYPVYPIVSVTAGLVVDLEVLP
ncbi:MAG: hypothetical protein IPM54_26840 [Polyangiaceae bacterium]|nr:hypothetical protein [Polyangiaceae bacterium]